MSFVPFDYAQDRLRQTQHERLLNSVGQPYVVALSGGDLGTPLRPVRPEPPSTGLRAGFAKAQDGLRVSGVERCTTAKSSTKGTLI
jgi:hypothetical protein